MPLGNEEAKENDQTIHPVAEMSRGNDVIQPEESVQPDDTLDIV